MTSNAEFITRQQAMDILGVTHTTLNKFLRQGLLTKYKKADGYFVRLSAREVQELRDRRHSWRPVP